MEALLICDKLKKRISDRTIEGRIHSVFQHACNLIAQDDIYDVDADADADADDDVDVDSDGLFITLITSGKVMAPRSILLDTGEGFDFKEAGLTQGAAFQMSDLMISFERKRDNSISEISIVKARSWQPECGLFLSGIEGEYSPSSQKLWEFKNVLFREGRFSGMERILVQMAHDFPELAAHVRSERNTVTADTHTEFIKKRFVSFMSDYIDSDGNMEKLKNSCSRIIGFGSGLTPSLDDFVNGLMLASICMAKIQKIQTGKVTAYHKAMLERSLGRTTRVSCEMLKNGAEGFANDAVDNLLRQLFFGSHQDVDDAVSRAVDFGETSGTDTALGIYAGLKLWTNYDIRRKFK